MLREASASLLLVLALAGPAAAVDIASCGQEVQEQETGILVADLDCSSLTGTAAVVLRRGATLDLQGHTIRAADTAGVGVACAPGGIKCRENAFTTICRASPKPCVVTSSIGRGSVLGDTGITSERAIVLEHLLIQPSGTAVRVGSFGIVTAEDVLIEGGTGNGIYGPDKVTHPGHGKGARVALRNVGIQNCGAWGISALAGSVSGSLVSVQDNGLGGIFTSDLRAEAFDISGNGAADNSDVCGGGICAARIALVDSAVTGNLRNGYPLDLASWWNKPKLRNSSCGTSGIPSYDPEPWSGWGVCSAD